MKFTRLRLSGFKSFVEPTELHIEPGLTAVIGPNGCGKSNLFDALRWVMGETRPTSIRGSEMDDVIFAGSAGRPARNTAEVILFVDNADRTASAPYNEYETIEISRRIEREAGSVYRINGRDVRQRDVQIFFADASSGASSTAFVRQGQIGLLISQKPLARRAILEEAAGIGGLHQRRHEAELRLRAAETNMSRMDDVIREGQLQSLKRQARQAARYRNLSGLIRKAEALALHLRWSLSAVQMRAAEAALEAAASAVTECTERSAVAATVQLNASADLPPLRVIEAEKGAALHRLIIERDALDDRVAGSVPGVSHVLRVLLQRAPAVARDGLAHRRKRNAQREQAHAADGQVLANAVGARVVVVVVDQESVERAHGPRVLVVHVHRSLKAALLVVHVDREVGPWIELSPAPLVADPRLGAVLEDVMVGFGEERRDGEEEVERPRQHVPGHVAADPIHPEPRQVQPREGTQRNATEARLHPVSIAPRYVRRSGESGVPPGRRTTVPTNVLTSNPSNGRRAPGGGSWQPLDTTSSERRSRGPDAWPSACEETVACVSA